LAISSRKDHRVLQIIDDVEKLNMCGIAGILGLPDPEPHLQRMVSSLRHRGPDDAGLQILEFGGHKIGLGSTRLAIIDLSPSGHMPMTDPETGSWITYNGEIYNFLELRSELERLGHTFRSRSDTEVILKAYVQWGMDCVERLRGMFAFALWDAQRGELFLARDRLGEKPLYYHEDLSRGIFLFASEVRALLASGFIERRLDKTSLHAYLFNGFTVAPRTIIANVHSLLPGHWMRVGPDGRVREACRYWRLPLYEDAQAAGQGDERLREVLDDVVKMRLLSDVPLGAFLSGGLDSSLVVALMSRPRSSVRTFSIGFHENQYDESGYARWVAEKFHTSHAAVTIGVQEFLDWLGDALSGMDQPTFDGLNTYFVARAARESGLTVALSGLGGDELFGGYPFFRSASRLSHLGRLGIALPNALKRWTVAHLGSIHGIRKGLHLFGEPVHSGRHLLAAYQTSVALFPSHAQHELIEGELPENLWFGLPQSFLKFLEEEGRDRDALSLLSKYVLRLFEGERTLRDSDSMSMAVSLEVRTVFTDHKLIEQLWQIPGKIRCAGAPDKPYQARLARPILGADYPLRRKQGFIFPFQEWLQQEKAKEQALETLQDTSLAKSIGLSPAAVQKLSGSITSQPWSRVWTIFVLLDWTRRHGVTL
jgi:asparagine synthase (glutamine-hydrolysing)